MNDENYNSLNAKQHKQNIKSLGRITSTTPLYHWLNNIKVNIEGQSDAL